MYSKLLAICVFHPTVWGTTAFFIQAPQALTSSCYSSDYLRSLSRDSEEKASTIQPRVTSTSLKIANISGMYGASSINGNASASAAEKAAYKAVSTPSSTEKNLSADIEDFWETASAIIVQGGSLRTWSETTGAVKRVEVCMKTEGRPLNANVELWHGPDNTPLKMSIYCEDGGLRPFSAVIETPSGQNTIAIRNTGQMEFPFAACVEPNVKDVVGRLLDMGASKTLQGGAMDTYPFGHTVGSVQVLLKTGGRPLNARIELLQGPNNDKQCIDIYCEDGQQRPFYAVIETPGTGNVVRIINTATVEFPITACVQPYLVDTDGDETGVKANGWDNGGTDTFRPRGKW
jgi:hypothetical protein